MLKLGKYMNFILDVLKHKVFVFWYMFKASMVLLWRGVVHDNSKFSKAEFRRFRRVYPKLKSAVYGTEEYYALLKELGPALKHHYFMNSHHPEYYRWADNSDYAQMTILDKLEMLCDWAAVTKRNNGNLYDSIVKGGEKYKYDSEEILRLRQAAQEMKLF